MTAGYIPVPALETHYHNCSRRADCRQCAEYREWRRLEVADDQWPAMSHSQARDVEFAIEGGASRQSRSRPGVWYVIDSWRPDGRIDRVIFERSDMR